MCLGSEYNGVAKEMQGNAAYLRMLVIALWFIGDAGGGQVMMGKRHEWGGEETHTRGTLRLRRPL